MRYLIPFLVMVFLCVACATTPEEVAPTGPASLAARGGDAAAKTSEQDIVTNLAQPGADAVIVLNKDEDQFSNPMAAPSFNLNLVANVAEAMKSDPIVVALTRALDREERNLDNAINDARNVDRSPENIALATAADNKVSEARASFADALAALQARADEVTKQNGAADLSSVKVFTYDPINIMSNAEDTQKLDSAAITALAALAEKLNAAGVKAVE